MDILLPYDDANKHSQILAQYRYFTIRHGVSERLDWAGRTVRTAVEWVRRYDLVVALDAQPDEYNTVADQLAIAAARIRCACDCMDVPDGWRR